MGSETLPAKPAPVWIMSPARDLLFLIATPLAIVPAVIWLAEHRFSPEQIALAVFAFASLGHHLPGLMRAYGDRELFSQFRWRFLLAPPLALAVCWLCFVELQLHGLELMLLVWATWHIMMQTYGFMRIYDNKAKRSDKSSARWDFLACVAVFASGVVFSDGRVFGMVEVLWLTGAPQFGPAWLVAARWLVGCFSGMVLAIYVVRTLSAGRACRSCWLKLSVLASATFLYWFVGQRTINLLIGVAMFEIYHAIQYFAIVWFYNRNRHQRVGRDFGPLGFMFRGNWWGLPLYILAIAAFGMIGLWSRSGNSEAASRMALALFSASALLHFYYDGFIWKVRQQKTRSNLNLASGSSESTKPAAWPALAAWSTAVVLLVSFSALELTKQDDEQQRLAALAKLTPNHPDLQARVSQLALLQGDNAAARQAATVAVQYRPESYAAQLALANAATVELDWRLAQQSYAAAARLRPDSIEAQFGLGLACLQNGVYDTARQSLERCLALQPDHAQAQFQLGNVFFNTNQPDRAASQYQRCTQLQPDFADAYNNLGASLFESDKFAAAIEAYRHAIRLQPENANAHFNLGLSLLSEGDATGARRYVEQAQQLGHPQSAEVLKFLDRSATEVNRVGP